MLFTNIDYTIHKTAFDKFLAMATEDTGYDIPATKFSRVKMLSIDDSVLLSDPLLQYIKNKYSFIYMIFKSPPNYHINYHVDSKRDFGLNISLTDSATAFFGDSDPEYYDKAMTNKKCPSFWNIRELKYNLGMPYVVNTKVYHSTLNLSDTNRYMLTFTFQNTNMNDFVADIASFVAGIKSS